MVLNTAVCGLSKVQLLTLDMPLHRVDFRIIAQDPGPESALYNRADSAHALFLKFNGSPILRHPKHRGIPKLLARPLNQKSDFFVHIFENGLIPSRALQPLRKNSRPSKEMADRVSDKILSTYDASREIGLRETFRVQGYLRSDESRGWFGMENLGRLGPLFAVCGFICSMLLFSERARRWVPSMVRRSIPFRPMVRICSPVSECVNAMTRCLLHSAMNSMPLRRTQSTLEK